MPHVPGRTSRHRWLSAAAIASLAAAGSLAGMPAASAAGDYLQFSADGRNYSSTFSGPVFRDSIIYVPGSTARGEVWVRNNSADPASLTSAAVMVRSDPELTGYLGLKALSGGRLSSRLTLGETGSCTDLNQAWNLGPGQSVKLSFVVDFALDAPNETRNRDADFDLLFLLGSQAAGQPARPACTAVGLPSTGGTDAGSGADLDDAALLPGTGRTADAVPAFVSGGAGTSGAAGAAGGLGASGGLAASGGAPWPKAMSKLEGPLASGFASTVEPVIRSMSGTLLIAVAVALAAAVVMRIRGNRYE